MFFFLCLFVRRFSYLALVTGLASEADFIFVPEDPPAINWPDKLCRKLLQVVLNFWFLIES